jgi:tetratricopeptide (TPR) repeat protein
MEVSYAESNLGTLFYDQGRYAEAELAFSRALNLMDTVAAGEKRDSARQLEIGIAINWLGKARSALNRSPEALALHHREIALYQNVLKADPANTQAKMLMAVAWQHIGQLEEIQGRSDAAMAAYGTSLVLIRQMRIIEPHNTEWQETEVRAMCGQFDNLYYQGKIAASRSMLLTATMSVEKLIGADPKNSAWAIDLRSMVQLRGAQLAFTDNRPEAALVLARAVTDRLLVAQSFDPSEKTGLGVQAGIYAGDALLKMGHRRPAIARWQAALDSLTNNPVSSRLQIRRARFMLLKRLGRKEEAVILAKELDRQGDRHPAYRREK